MKFSALLKTVDFMALSLVSVFLIFWIPIDAYANNNACQPYESAISRTANPLHYAAYEGDVDEIKTLVARGANISAKDKCGLTPMAAALSNRPNGIVNIDAIKVLVASGADINERGAKGESILLLAITSIGSYTVHAMPEGWGRQAADIRVREFVAWAIDNHANVNTLEPASETTPLHFAVIRNEKTLVSMLLKAGGNVNAKTKNNVTPLSVAIRRNYQEIADMLRQSGAKL